MIDKWRSWHEQYKHWLPGIFFIAGFLFDVLTLDRVDDFFNILSQVAYIALVLAILVGDLLAYTPPEQSHKTVLFLHRNKTEVFHFFLGSLLSAFTIFYFKSSSLSNSFLFMFFMAALLIVNEFEIFKGLGTAVKSATISLCMLSFFLYLCPVIFGSVGPLMFALSLLITGGIIWPIGRWLLKKGMDQRSMLRNFLVPQYLVLVFFVLLYILKIIPPVPLSLKYVGVYHDVIKEPPQYRLIHQRPWWKFWHHGDQDFLARTGDRIFVFVRIFSPGGFEGKVQIHWLYKNHKGNYETSDRIPLLITGGRGEGFRGHTFKANYTPGDWMVKVETQDELEIGRVYFNVESMDSIEPREFKTSIQ